MKSEIKIILEDGSSNKAKGTCFESLVRNILTAHQYNVTSSVNFTGMEIDLLAKHKIRNEILYVECKAKEKVSSTEIRNFWFNVTHKKANHGYFIRTKELESHAAGLLAEMKNDTRYDNLTFIEPIDVIQTLKENNIIEVPVLPTSIIVTKQIFCVTYFGDFFIYVITKDSVIPTNFIVFNAKGGIEVFNNDTISKLKVEIDDINDLNQLIVTQEFINPALDSTKQTEYESISEVQESENWFDYLPASSKHFVGRDTIRNQIFDFFKNANAKQTNRRVFYLTGKSGWGKSSLIAEIRGRCRNRHYKKKYFAYAVDTRSATSQNFVALSFKEMIRKAQLEGFIDLGIFLDNLNFTSSQELLTSDSVKSILEYLSKRKKILVLIFDQFEDVFRRQGLFKSFYKFLSDVTDSKSNIIVGFSWKTEILIPSENEAYHYWQQAKEQAVNFVVPEFAAKEIDGVISQLERSVSKITHELKRRIKENSQGLPWLTKKLCIHVYEQMSSGTKADKLIDENLNIQVLFENDLEKIKGDELSALKYIANKAYDGTFFDISELGDKVSENTVESLRDKRLIIRSGANYNIYWDIFRDYLVTKEIPPIGESYILRQGAKICLEVFLLFKDTHSQFTIDTLQFAHPRNIGKTTLENILIELRNVGLVHKIEGRETYKIARDDISVTRVGFINYITNKFQNYTPYLKIIKKGLKHISKEDVIEILKNTFKYNFQEKTWETYSTTLIGWLLLSNLDIKSRLQNPQKGRRRLITNAIEFEKIFLRTSKKELLAAVYLIKKGRYSRNCKKRFTNYRNNRCR